MGFFWRDVVIYDMEETLEDIQFLANSMNRIQVLDALTSGTATRRELQEATGTPRSTAARVLEEGETRGWINSNGSRYRITPEGEAMISTFTTYMEATEGIQHLGRAIDWLPEPARALDFRYFRDANITTPSEGNPTAAFDRGMELIRTADQYHGLTQNSLPEYMKTISNRVRQGDLAFQGVIEADFIEILHDEPGRAAHWHDVADQMWLYDGQIPINMHIVDDSVLIWLCDKNEAGDDVVMKGLLESDHPAVVSWAESLYWEYRDEAEPLDPSMLPEV